MVKHIVMFKLGGLKEEKLKACNDFKSALMSLKGIIPEIKDIEVGINGNPAESWDLVLTVNLDSMEDIPVYAAHPEHVKAVGIIAPFKEARACVDYIV